MATTIAQIAKQAMDAVALAVTDAIKVAELSYTTESDYNTTTGKYDTITTTIINGGRAVLDTVKPINDAFPSYVAGPSDQLFLLEGFTTVPAEGWGLAIAEVGYEIRQVQDIALAGSLFYVVAIQTGGDAIVEAYFISDYFASDYFEATA